MKDPFLNTVKKYVMSVLLAFVMLFSLMTVPGCGGGSSPIPVQTPEQQQEVAKQGGSLAVALFLAVEQPDADETAAVKTVIDLLASTLKDYRQGGFITAKEEIGILIKQKVPEKYQNTANSISGALLLALDGLFSKHPEWKDKNDQVSGIVSSFFIGANDGFGVVRSARELKRSAPKPK